MIFTSSLICRKSKSKKIKSIKKEKANFSYKEYAIIMGMISAIIASANTIESRFFREKEESTINITINIPTEPCSGNVTVIYTAEMYSYECIIADVENPVIKQIPVVNNLEEVELHQNTTKGENVLWTTSNQEVPTQ